MTKVRTDVYAKLNLTLDVLGKEGAYHRIDSLVVQVDLFDRVVVRKRRDRLVSVTMHGMGSEKIPPEENAAQRAGEAFVSAFGTTGADISVYKNIPVGGGLGGSSADVAGVIEGLSRLYGAGDRAALKALCDGLGSDAGYLLSGGFARMTGRGERIEPLGPSPRLFFLLLVPKAGVLSSECYRKRDEFPPAEPHTDRALACLRSGNLEWATKLFSNDLFPAAKALLPDVERAAEELRQFSPLCVNMTGSGSGVYAIFETEELCAWAKSRYRGKYPAYLLKTAEPKKSGNLFSLDEEEI